MLFASNYSSKSPSSSTSRVQSFERLVKLLIVGLLAVNALTTLMSFGLWWRSWTTTGPTRDYSTSLPSHDMHAHDVDCPTNDRLARQRLPSLPPARQTHRRHARRRVLRPLSSRRPSFQRLVVVIGRTHALPHGRCLLRLGDALPRRTWLRPPRTVLSRLCDLELSSAALFGYAERECGKRDVVDAYGALSGVYTSGRDVCGGFAFGACLYSRR